VVYDGRLEVRILRDERSELLACHHRCVGRGPFELKHACHVVRGQRGDSGGVGAREHTAGHEGVHELLRRDIVPDRTLREVELPERRGRAQRFHGRVARERGGEEIER